MSMQTTPRAPVAPTASRWDLMETRMVTAKVDGLLERASTDLAQLAASVELSHDLMSGLIEALRAIDASQQTLATVRTRVSA
jgi:hypothetical protein